MEGKIITLKEFDSVKYLLSKVLNHQEIAETMKIGKRTVSRIANGEHPLQLGRIERKLDLLLKELM